jgi:hypothetical protein
MKKRKPTLQDGVGGDCTDCDTWQQRGEEEEIARTDDSHIIFGRIKILEKCSRPPATANDDDILLRRVMWQLRTGIPLPLSDVIEDTTSSHDSDKGDSSESLKAATPCGQFRVGWRRRGLQAIS